MQKEGEGGSVGERRGTKGSPRLLILDFPGQISKEAVTPADPATEIIDVLTPALGEEQGMGLSTFYHSNKNLKLEPNGSFWFCVTEKSRDTPSGMTPSRLSSSCCSQHHNEKSVASSSSAYSTHEGTVMVLNTYLHSLTQSSHKPSEKEMSTFLILQEAQSHWPKGSPKVSDTPGMRVQEPGSEVYP